MIAAVAATASIPLPDVLLEVIRYGTPNLSPRKRAHRHYCLRSLDTLLLAHTASNEQRINLATV